MHRVLPATDTAGWRSLLTKVGEVDPSFLPEYHQAYSLRIRNSTPVLWHYEGAGGHLLYPFLLTPVVVEGSDTGFRDISGIYGYTGPIATSAAADFLAEAWREFDGFAAAQKVIAEFVRFSPFNHTERFAHPRTKVEANRDLAVSELPATEEALLQKLGPKTRNMLRKAERAGLVSRELPLPGELGAFRRLYEETMSRNQAPEFFWYDDAYYEKLLALGKDGLRLFGVFAGDRLVAAAMTVVHGKAALYHLGASLMEYAKQGAGNLSLFQMSRDLIRSGVAFVNMTGGRTTSPDDPLLLFKRSNATGTAPFHIGKRIVDADAYRSVGETWRQRAGREPDAAKIIFWRA
jgi:hypothetical protein